MEVCVNSREGVGVSEVRSKSWRYGARVRDTRKELDE